jgi:hypothetical protein
VHECLTDRDARFAWASRTTLIGAAPLDLRFAQFRASLLAAGRDRGAAIPVTVAPSTSTGHVGADDRSSLSSQLDADELQVAACYNPAEAVRLAVQTRGLGLRFRYDDETLQLTLADDDGHGVNVDVQLFGLEAIRSGVLPEDFIGAAVEEASYRLSRLRMLADGLRDTAGAETVKFLDGLPVIVTANRIILDPAASDYLSGSDAYEFHSSAALEAPLTTPCTCTQPRAVSATLRPRAAVYSFDSERDQPPWLFVPILDRHCLIFEIACPHAAVRPTTQQWETGGWDIGRCLADWEERPVLPPIDCVRESSWLHEAVMVLGREVSATAAQQKPASALLRRLGFSPGASATLYAANANLLLASTESFETQDVIRHALNTRFFRALERMRRPCGADVSFLTRRTVEHVPALVAPVNEIPLVELVGAQTL